MTAHGVGDSDLRRRYAQVFDDVAEEYDRERRGYPDELIDAACRAGALSAGDRVVEVGCGTGLLTTSLLARGLRVEAIDPGANMIRLARRRVGEGASVRFHRGRFEDLTLPDPPFAALFSATAFHWIEPEVGWARAAELLRSGRRARAAPALRCVGREHGRMIRARYLKRLRRSRRRSPLGWPELRDAHAILNGAAARGDNISEVWSWIGPPRARRPGGGAPVPRRPGHGRADLHRARPAIS